MEGQLSTLFLERRSVPTRQVHPRQTGDSSVVLHLAYCLFPFEPALS